MSYENEGMRQGRVAFHRDLKRCVVDSLNGNHGLDLPSSRRCEGGHSELIEVPYSKCPKNAGNPTGQ